MWLIYIALTTIWLIQTGAMFSALSLGWMASENGPLQVSILILLIGVLGGVVISLQKRKGIEEHTIADTITLLITVTLATIGAFVAVFPLMIIFNQGITEAVLLTIGLLSPVLGFTRLFELRSRSNA